MDEEQPIAIAFTDGKYDSRMEELVFKDQIFWGTIMINYTKTPIAYINAKNTKMIEQLIKECLPKMSMAIQKIIARMTTRYPRTIKV